MSCKFELDEVSPTKVILPESKDFKIELSAADSSQIVLYKSTSFTYSVESNSELELYLNSIIITIDGERVRTIPAEGFEEAIEFAIDPKEIEDGPHILGITGESIHVGNTLAAAAGKKFDVIGEWDILVDKTVDPFDISNIEIVNGELVVSWDPDAIRNFDHFTLIGVIDETGPKRLLNVDPLADQSVFPYYLSGELDLSIATYTDGELQSEGSSIRFSLEEDIVDFLIVDSAAVVRLSKPTLHNHINSFIIDNVVYESLEEGTNDYPVRDNLIFGEEVKCGITFLLGPNDLAISSNEFVGFGTKLPPYNTMIYSEVNNCYYALLVGGIDSFFGTSFDEGTIVYRMNEFFEITHVYEYVEFDESDSPSLAMNASQDQVVVTITDTKDVVFLRANNLQEIRTINLRDDYNYTDRSFLIQGGSKVTSNDIYFLRGPSHIAVDLTSNELIFRGPFYSGNGDISDDGKYIFSDGNILEWNGSEYVFSSVIDEEYKSGTFISDVELLHFSNQAVRVIDVSTMNILESFTFNDFERYQYSGINSVFGGTKVDSDKRILLSYPFLREDLLEVYDFQGNSRGVYQVHPDVALVYPMIYINSHLMADRAFKITL